MIQADKIVSSCLKGLSPRAKDVISRRFGIGRKSRETLESIGQGYGITRERVRQIENAALNKIRVTHESMLREMFDYLRLEMDKRGGLVKEDSFLNNLGTGAKDANYFNFFLNLGADFTRFSESDEFHSHWTADKDKTERVHTALTALRKELGAEDLLSENDVVAKLLVHLNGQAAESASTVSPEVAVMLLGVSKKIGRNHLGEWGVASSPHITPKGMRDMACLVLRKYGKPMHFTEIASSISSLVNKPAHVQTVHNELIKDEQFVLVGRGLYALSSMGYRKGVVSDVIKEILASKGALAKDDIIKEVLKERYVKEGTILINLQNKNYFRRTGEGHYTLA